MRQTTLEKRNKIAGIAVAGVLAVSATTVLSVLAMPGPDFGWLAWLALIPQVAWVVLSKDSASIKGSFVLVGIWLKWMILLIWLRHVAWVAVPLLALMMAGWELLWWWVLRASADRGFFNKLSSGVFVCVGMGLLWGVLEHVRSQPWGFPMLHWAVSQWKNPSILSICGVVGGYGLSSFMVAANLLLFLFLKKTLVTGARWKGVLAILLLVGVVLTGWMVSKKDWSEPRRELEQTEKLRIAVVQPYQPAYRTWTRESMHETVDTVFKLSMDVVRKDAGIDWMLWPEGTLPWAISEGNAMDVELSRLVKLGLQVPLLVGNMGKDERGVFNGVHHYDRLGDRQKPAYAKQVLVPYGEFIPGRRWFPWISTIVPIPDDFVRGTESVLYTLEPANGGKKVRVSPLICYEDCFPFLSVQAARAGAEVLFVATYNVWYGEEWGSYVHASHALIRSAETGLPVVRCGSAGWSGSIAGGGRIHEVATESGSIYFRGTSVLELPVVRDPALTFYVRYSEWIQGLWLLLSGVFLAVLWRSPR